MFVAKQNQKTKSPDATGLPRGDSRLQLFSCEHEPSTAQGRGIPSSSGLRLGSNQREVPRDQPVASFSDFLCKPVAYNGRMTRAGYSHFSAVK